MDRRDFLGSGALALAGASALALLESQDAEAAALFRHGREEREALAKGWLSPAELQEHFPAYFPPDKALTPLTVVPTMASQSVTASQTRRATAQTERSHLQLIADKGDGENTVAKTNAAAVDRRLYRIDKSGELLDYDGKPLRQRDLTAPDSMIPARSRRRNANQQARDYTDTASQFLIYQLVQNPDGSSLRSPHQITLPPTPTEQGTDKPRNQSELNIRMDTLHIAESEADDIHPQTKATMRFTVGDDMALSEDARIEPIFWTVSAGLEFYEQLKERKKFPQSPLRTDFVKAMAGNGARLNDGLGRVQFQVLKHPKPDWWQQVFSFVVGDVGRKLISTLGFPSVTVEAVNYISSLVNTIGGKRAQPLFRSMPLRLAFHQGAQASYLNRNPAMAAMGNAVTLGGLTSGLWVLTRASSFGALQDSHAFYDAYLGRLVPGNERQAVLQGRYFNDDYRDFTYAILDVSVSNG